MPDALYHLSFDHNDPKQARQAIRTGLWSKPTAGLAPGYVQANLAVLPKKYAFDFLLFATRNPKPCPILEVAVETPLLARLSLDADVRTDFPCYYIYRHGVLVQETNSLIDLWQDDFCSFLIGCSFSFENALLKASIPVRHVEEGKNVPMYITNIACQPAGIFSGPTVVSMRPVPLQLIERAIQITSRFPSLHGAPLHIGEPRQIGIKDLDKPDFGDSVTIKEGEVPVFWACGVTPQAVALAAKPDLMITHGPGHMFISDLTDEEFAAF